MADPSWQGKVYAEGESWLLGGVKVHTSVLFQTVEQATRWVAEVVWANMGAGRVVREGLVRPVPEKPGVYAENCGTCFHPWSEHKLVRASGSHRCEHPGCTCTR